MPNVLIDSATMEEIGNAIREKTGKSDKLFPRDMPAAIRGISGGGGSTVNVFGVMWNYADPSTALTRLDSSNDPNGFANVSITEEPNPAVGDGEGSSPFDAYAPWNGMEEYNIIDSEVGPKRGADGFSRSDYDTMVYIPEFYYHVVDDPENQKRYWYVSDGEVDGFEKHPGSGRYVGRYDTISGHYSKTGAAPLVNTSRPDFRTGAKGKGKGWYMYDYASWCAVWLLYLVEFADWDSQRKIGQGVCGGSSAELSAAVNVGATDSMKYHTGKSASTATASVQYRHIENPWGNVRDWIDGINFSDRAAYVCTNPDNYADGTSTNYTAAGVTISSGSGYIKTVGMSSAVPWAFLPTANGGSETTYVPDYVNSSPGWRALYVGGYYSATAGNCGLFYFIANYSASFTTSTLGARLLFIP